VKYEAAARGNGGNHWIAKRGHEVTTKHNEYRPVHENGCPNNIQSHCAEVVLHQLQAKRRREKEIAFTLDWFSRLDRS